MSKLAIAPRDKLQTHIELNGHISLDLEYTDELVDEIIQQEHNRWLTALKEEIEFWKPSIKGSEGKALKLFYDRMNLQNTAEKVLKGLITND